MRLKLRFSLRTFLLLPVFLFLGLLVVWAWPKSQPLSLNQSVYTGYYRGLGRHDGAGFFGKNFYRLVAEDGPYGYWEVDYSRPGYNPYRGYYPDGTLREEGECLVEINGGDGDPAPDNNDVRSGRYYRPDEALGSKVVDGTGTQTLWYPDGTLRWELVLEDCERVRHSMWHENGQLRQTQHYKNGEVDGDFKSYYENGVVELQGSYTEGRRSGVWTWYDDRGGITSTDDHTGAPLKTKLDAGGR